MKTDTKQELKSYIKFLIKENEMLERENKILLNKLKNGIQPVIKTIRSSL
jgi:regulator of replication initiation timing